MGGAGFSTVEKIKLSYQAGVHTVIVNLCECEPIISCDQALTEQYPKEILSGITTMINNIQAQKAIIVLEDNKVLARQKLEMFLHDYPFISLHIVPSIYPSGHEKQLVEYVSGNKVVANKRPVDYGYVVFNVATCYALWRYLYHNEPLTQRLITISDGKKIVNQWVYLGTPIMNLLQQHDISYNPQNQHLIMGGPMNGEILSDLSAGVSKNMNCLLVLSQNPHLEIDTQQSSHSPCIRCGECVKVCPVNLLPQQLFWFAQAKQTEKAEQYHLFDCIECGNCSFVCPSEIPLVQYYRIQKKQISEQKLEQYKVDKAKERYEKRNQRLQTAKLKHQEMLQQKHLQAQQKLAAKQAAQAHTKTEEKSTDTPSRAVAIARAKALARKKQKAQATNP